MITPDQLTKENGFEDGVVVEYETTDDDKDVEYFDEAFRKMFIVRPDACDWFTSIRPLTGPMAIWNFAPEWATHVEKRDEGDFLWWALDKDAIVERCSRRPFWARTME